MTAGGGGGLPTREREGEIEGLDCGTPLGRKVLSGLYIPPGCPEAQGARREGKGCCQPHRAPRAAEGFSSGLAAGVAARALPAVLTVLVTQIPVHGPEVLPRRVLPFSELKPPGPVGPTASAPP